jgi:capsular polysaccharide biosynthesis protein
MINLKKLIYQYRYLKLEEGDVSEEHSKLVSKFESDFSEYIPKTEPKPQKQKVTKKESVDNNVKKIYKDIAKQLHPDKGGDEEQFKELNERYKSNDLLGVIDYAVENDIQIELDESDTHQLVDSIENLETKIQDLKGTLAYVWEYGNQIERLSVLSTLSKHLKKDIKQENLSNEIKVKLGYKVKK